MTYSTGILYALIFSFSIVQFIECATLTNEAPDGEALKKTSEKTVTGTVSRASTAVRKFQKENGKDTALLYSKVGDMLSKQADAQVLEEKKLAIEIEKLEKEVAKDSSDTEAQDKLDKLQLEKVELGKEIVKNAAKAKRHTQVARAKALKNNSTAVDPEILQKKEEKAKQLLDKKSKEIKKTVADVEKRAEEKLKKLPKDSKEAKQVKEKVAKLEKVKAAVIDTEVADIEFEEMEKKREKDEKKNKESDSGDDTKKDKEEEKKDKKESEELEKRKKELNKEKKQSIEKKKKMDDDVKEWEKKHKGEVENKDKESGEKNKKKEDSEKKKDNKSKPKETQDKTKNTKKPSVKGSVAVGFSPDAAKEPAKKDLPQNKKEWLKLKEKTQGVVNDALTAPPKSTQRRRLTQTALDMNDALAVSLAGHIDELQSQAATLAQKKLNGRVRRSTKSRKRKTLSKAQQYQEQKRKAELEKQETEGEAEDEDDYNMGIASNEKTEESDHTANSDYSLGSDDDDDDDDDESNSGSKEEEDEDKSKSDDDDDDDDTPTTFPEIRRYIQQDLFPELKYLINEKSFLTGMVLEGLNKTYDAFGIRTVNHLARCFSQCRGVLNKDARMEQGIAKLIASKVTGSPSALQQAEWKNFTISGLEKQRIMMYALAYEAAIFNQLADAKVVEVMPETARIAAKHLIRKAEKGLAGAVRDFKLKATIDERYAKDFYANEAATKNFITELATRDLAKENTPTTGELQAQVTKAIGDWVPDLGELLDAADSSPGLSWKKLHMAMRG